MSEGEKQAAAKRWQAVEGFNLHPDLSCLARRLGILLVSLNNSTTRASFQSQPFLATMLGCDERSIRRALIELTEQDLVEYDVRSRKCHYQVKFWAMADVVDEARLTAKTFMEVVRKQQKNTGRKCPVSDGKTPTPDIPVTDTGRECPVTPDENVRLSYPNLSSPKDLPQGAASAAVAPVGASASALTEEGAMRKARRSERRFVPYPRLYEAFEDEPAMIEALDRLPRDIQHDASKRLALEGREAAAAFVREQAA